MQKRLYDSGSSAEMKCRGCNKEEGMEKHRLYHCPSWREVRNQNAERLEKIGAKGHNLEERLEVAKMNHDPPSG